MTITLQSVGPPPGVLPGSPIHQVGDVVIAKGENNLSTGIPIPIDAVPGDLVSVWFLNGGDTLNTVAENFWSWPRPITLSGGAAGSGSTSGRGAYLDHFWFQVQENEPGSVIYLNWDYGGFEGLFAMRAICYHGHDTETPITSWGEGYRPTTNITLGKSGSVAATMASQLLEVAIGFNANTNLGTDADGSGEMFDATFISEGPLALLVGWVDIGYPYNWGGGPGGDGAVTTFHQGSTLGVSGAGAGWGFAINPMPKPGPIAFGLTNKAGDVGAYMDAADGLTAGWTYRPRAGQGPQVGWIVAREHVDGTQLGFWNDGLGTWESSQFVNYSDLASLAWPDGAWTNDGHQWNVQGAIIEGEQFLPSDISAPVTFTARARPVVTVTAPYGNVGSTPTAAWTVANGPGTAYRVRFFNSAQYLAAGFDPGTSSPASESGWVSGVGLTWAPSSLLGGGYYRAYVQVQKDNQLSDWAYGSFFANYATLATPTITTVASLDPITGCPRTAITVTGHDAVGFTGTTYANVFRYDPVGQVMVPIRFGQDVPLPWPSQSVTLYDYDMAPNQAVTYQAQVYSTKPSAILTLDDATLGLLDDATHPLG